MTAMKDRVTKILLGMIVAALWGILLNLMLAPSHAQPARAPVAVAAGEGLVFVVTEDGMLHIYENKNGTWFPKQHIFVR
jgi:hypothetical protein